MARHFPNWLTAFVESTSHTEAPDKMRFWTGVSTIAGALRRKVWLPQDTFTWYPNFYIIFVANPGIVSKTTTMDTGIKLLRQIPGIKFGPNAITWQALVKSLAGATEEFSLPDGTFVPMSAITIAAGELGTLLTPSDCVMVDAYVALWDSPEAFAKETKGSGNDSIVNAWLNIIACTTPSWIAGNFPEYMVGGGFTSRCIFVYTEEKAKYVAYPGLATDSGWKDRQKLLIQDLEHIALTMAGDYRMTKEAVEWGEEWYTNHYKNRPKNLDDARFGGYVARKQSHIHKLAMVLAAAQRDRLVITMPDLQEANRHVTVLEEDMPKVFSLIGRTDMSLQTERFIRYIERKKVVDYDEAYRYVHDYFPDAKQFESIVDGAVKAGYIKMMSNGSKSIFHFVRN